MDVSRRCFLVRWSPALLSSSSPLLSFETGLFFPLVLRLPCFNKFSMAATYFFESLTLSRTIPCLSMTVAILAHSVIDASFSSKKRSENYPSVEGMKRTCIPLLNPQTVLQVTIPTFFDFVLHDLIRNFFTVLKTRSRGRDTDRPIDKAYAIRERIVIPRSPINTDVGILCSRDLLLQQKNLY
jgi:hypothetical protein